MHCTFVETETERRKERENKVGIQNRAFDEDKTFKRDKKGKKIEAKHNDQPPPPPMCNKKRQKILNHTLPSPSPNAFKNTKPKNKKIVLQEAPTPFCLPPAPLFSQQKSPATDQNKKKKSPCGGVQFPTHTY